MAAVSVVASARSAATSAVGRPSAEPSSAVRVRASTAITLTVVRAAVAMS